MAEQRLEPPAHLLRDLGLAGIPLLDNPLAVVGGGPSIDKHVETLKNWPGEVWAINGALAWCREHEIEATFFAVDPDPIVVKWARYARRAIIEQSCDPGVFESLADDGAEVITFDTGHEACAIRAAGSSASAVPHVAIRMGFHEVTLFGCESSYPADLPTHAYQDEKRADQMLVACGGDYFLTCPDFYVYVQYLSDYIAAVPEFIKEESGGLLRAMIQNKGEHSIRWVSESMARGLAKVETPVKPAPEVEKEYHFINGALMCPGPEPTHERLPEPVRCFA